MPTMHQSAAELPQKHTTLRLGGKDPSQASPNFYDVKFYPYVQPNTANVFAVAGTGGVYICNVPSKPENTVQVLQAFDEDEQAANDKRNLPPICLTWAQDVENRIPLLCYSGESTKIKIIHATEGKLVKTLVGHGYIVNDLATCPTNPSIIASGSVDSDIRIWYLDPKYEKQPCAAILGGSGGHAEGLLSISFHSNGRYLLSGGMDATVKMWALPEFPDENAGTDKTTQVHYPYFSSNEVHTDFVDCLRFYNDLIISRSAKENTIHIWQIDNFSSSQPVPPVSAAPIPSSTKPTVSAFGGHFQRLLTLDTPNSSYFYMRFGLFHQPHKHPILVMGNERSKFFIWDLQRLAEEGHGVFSSPAADAQGFKKPSKPQKKGHAQSARASAAAEARANSVSGSSVSGRPSVMPSPVLGREESIVSNTSSGMSGPMVMEKKNVNRDPFKPITAHRNFTVGKVNFASRAIDWSPGGEWCAAAGDNGMICLFRRWKK